MSEPPGLTCAVYMDLAKRFLRRVIRAQLYNGIKVKHVICRWRRQTRALVLSALPPHCIRASSVAVKCTKPPSVTDLVASAGQAMYGPLMLLALWQMRELPGAWRSLFPSSDLNPFSYHGYLLYHLRHHRLIGCPHIMMVRTKMTYLQQVFNQ